MRDTPAWRPPSCYGSEHLDRLESTLVRIGLAGPIVDAAAFDVDPMERNIFYVAADVIQSVIHRREAQKDITGAIRLVFVEHPAHAARITRFEDGGLIVLTTTLLLNLQAFALQVAETRSAAAIFAMKAYEGTVPRGTWEQWDIANGLLQAMLAVLANHEIAHLVLGHFEVLEDGLEAFPEEPVEALADDAFRRQVLEIDADSFAIGRTFRDILAGAYPTAFGLLLMPEGWRARLLPQESDSATRLVTLANLLLWTFLDGRHSDEARWQASHPPPLFRCLAAIAVLGGDVAHLKEALYLGRRVVNSEQCETGYHRAVEAFKAFMRELGNPASARLTQIYDQQMDDHTERLRPIWDALKVDLPYFRKQVPSEV